jgi:vitamin B12 transporter
MHLSTARPAAAFALALAAPLAAPLAFAADAAPDGATVVVTATRTPERADRVLADVTVIGNDEIARAGAGSVADVLARQRGIEIVRNGGPGASTSVYLRGANSNQVVVLIDGVRTGSSTTGAASWNAIPLAAIDRIEVVYGPLGTLYGADAIGGVVQIFTKRGEGPAQLSAGIGGGSWGTRQADAAVHGAGGAISYAFGAAHEAADGFSSTRPGASSYNRDDDGYRRNSANGRIALRLADGIEAGAQFLQSRLRAQYDNGASSFDTRNLQDIDSYALFLNGRVLPAWRSSLQLARSDDKLGSLTGSAPSGSSRIDTRQDDVTWQNTIDIGADTLQLLVGHRKETVLSTSGATTAPSPLDGSRITNSAAASYALRRGSHLLDLSARNDHSIYGSKTTGAAGYGYDVNRDLRASASIGTSFRAPTFNELYFPGYGLPDNKPEQGRNAQAGLRYEFAGVALQASYYRNKLSDMIVSVNPCPSRSCAYNVNHALLEGLTLSATARIQGVDLRASADLQDPRDETTGKQLARRARRHASLSASRTTGRLESGIELRASGHRFDDAANANRLGGYALLNLYTRWHLTPDWSLLVRLDNAADKRYELARNYGTAGRGWFAALRYGIR